MEDSRHPFLTYRHNIDPERAMNCLETNLGFMLDGESLSKGVLLDEDADDFYALPEHRGIDFTTLEGFMNYAYLLGKQDGKHEVQHDMKKALGL